MASIHAQLEKVKEQREEQYLRHKREMEILKSENYLLEMRMSAMKREAKQNITLHRYACHMKEASASKVDSMYVLRIQSQLCWALHRKGVMKNQLNLVRQGGKKIVQSLQVEVSEKKEMKSKREMELINQIVALDVEMNSIAESKEEEFREQLLVLQQLEKEMTGEEAYKPGDASRELDSFLIEKRIEKKGHVSLMNLSTGRESFQEALPKVGTFVPILLKSAMQEPAGMRNFVGSTA